MGALPKSHLPEMTVAQFLDWDSGDRSGRLWQLCDGVPRAMAPTILAHGAVQNELGFLIRLHLRNSGSRCTVMSNPGVVPRARATDNVRIPDLGVTCRPFDAAKRVLEEPVLLIEILSRSNQAETWSNVWSYTTIPSIAEILVVSSLARRADLLRRQPDGAWPEQPARIEADGTLHLASIGLALPLADIYRTSGVG
jgi:Uma2 family endonuclease